MIAYFLSFKDTHNIVDKTYYTYGSELTWEEKNSLVFFVNDVLTFKSIYGADQNSTRYVPLVHTLTNINIYRKCMVRF